MLLPYKPLFCSGSYDFKSLCVIFKLSCIHLKELRGGYHVLPIGGARGVGSAGAVIIVYEKETGSSRVSSCGPRTSTHPAGFMFM